MLQPTPTASGLPEYRPAGFETLPQALDYAAQGATGINIYSGKGILLEALSYRELREQSLVLARKLLARGLKPGQRVALIGESDGDFARAFFACEYAGLVPTTLPLPAAFGGRAAYVAHIRRMIEIADASAAFAPAALVEWLAEAVDGLNLVVSGILDQLKDDPDDGRELPVVGAEDLCYLQFSSGSTRFPLGVAVTQRALIANVYGIACHGLGIGPTDRCSSWLPLYHDMGLIGFLLTPLACQISVDMFATRDFARRPLLWLELITRNGGTLSYSPSFGYELAARRAETASSEGLDLSCWRGAGIGGDMVRPEPLAKFAEQFAVRGFKASAFVPSYGMAETALALSFAPAGQGIRFDTLDSEKLERENLAVPAAAGTERRRDFVLCGPALPDHAFEVRGESGKLLTTGQVGRIYARGPSMMQGYYGQLEATEAVLAADGWLDTGDLGYFRDGQIVITGRAKDLIIVNGRNIWPQDLEWTVEREVSVLRSGDVAAVSVDDGGSERIVVLVEFRTADDETRDNLKKEVAGVLRMRHGVETDVVTVPPRTLPRTSSGKLSRSKAKTMYLQGSFVAAAPVSSS
ncbi:fatty acyl-AMP ligase [Nevskia ramosa]|uniref:fatty acyl-AMP ligase n=1 Tax=Nevskia ramosa TaxID=64002 RepID=UPI0003B35D1B|nr:fatty acyl-AMP ligase [Nevskia ramosa]